MTAPRPGSDTDRARRVQELFERAWDLAPAARAKLLAEACGDDRALRAEVEELLATVGQGETQDFLPPIFTPEAAAPPSRLVGKQVNNYEVVRHLAGGGMGAIYLVRHTVFNRYAALKVLHAPLADSAEMVRRFLNEARAANAVRHPNIVEVIDAGRLEGSGAPYILMEYLPGESLGARLQRQPRLPVTQAVAITREIASALAAAHAKGIVHRDLKPENVFLVAARSGTAADGAVGPGRVKVLDFGIAKLRREIAGTLVQTRMGAGYGTPAYMSPEQCRDFSSVDPRTDVYALGVMLYEMVCGRRPFESSSFADLIQMQLTQEPKAPRQIGVDLPAALESAIMKALAKDREQRFASMTDLAAALGAAKVRSGPSRREIASVAAGVVAAILTAAAGISLVRRSSAPETRTPAEMPVPTPP